MTEAIATNEEEQSTPLDALDMFVVDDSESGISDQSIADNELLVDKLVAEWSDLMQRSEDAGSGFDDGIESQIGSDLEKQFTEARRTKQLERRSNIVDAFSAARDRGWITAAELADILPNGAATDEAISEIALHLDAAGIAIVQSYPEEGAEPLDTNPSGCLEDLDDELAIAEGMGSCTPIYQPRVGWISSPHDPLRTFVHHIAKKPLLSKYEEISLGRRAVAALKPVAQLIHDHPAILDWPELRCAIRPPYMSVAGRDKEASLEAPATQNSAKAGPEDLEDGDEESMVSESADDASTDLWALARAVCKASANINPPSELGNHANRIAARALSAAEAIRNVFAESNFKLVFSIATRYMGRGLEVSDLVQEGVLGLLRGIEKWDPERGWKLSTYATWWIRQSITRALADKGGEIRVPVHMVEKLNQVHGVQRTLERELGRAPSTEETAIALNTDAAFVTRTMKMRRTIVDIATLDPESEWVVGGDSAIDYACREDSNAQIDMALSSLDKREAEVVRLRFGIAVDEELTLEEVGKQFGVTRERIRQIEKKALMRLRHPSRAASLAELLDQQP
ncbi:MAG: sigma-70 family RNA polymerase sigma factor [Rhodanobacter sp.]|mgnify:CR=1 FL=1|nr:sigma-70 family RNA polymerase sigma factor [Rhodanobacter sp.]